MAAQDKPRFVPGSRVTLAAGFGGLLIVVALAGMDALRVLREIRVEDERIRTQFLLRNHLLNDLRSKLYLSGTYVRDYLLDPDAARADEYRASLERKPGRRRRAAFSGGSRAECRA